MAYIAGMIYTKMQACEKHEYTAICDDKFNSTSNWTVYFESKIQGQAECILNDLCIHSAIYIMGYFKVMT